MVERGELSAEQAEARLRAIEQAVAAEGNAKTGSLDARTVLRAVKRVDLTSDQKESIRIIERDAARAYHKISRKDKQAHTELAKLVKAKIDQLLSPEQAKQFEAALERLDRGSRRSQQPPRRKVAPENDTDAKKAP
jgi:Spy/CpxP family protein refolding chaperone